MTKSLFIRDFNSRYPMTMRRLKMGLSTILGLKKQGFFIPYRYADTVPTRAQDKPYAALQRLMQQKEEGFDRFLNGMGRYSEELSSFGEEAPPAPRWEQDWFPRLDAAAAYTMVRDEKPATIIEVGSGHSTRFMMRAIQDGGINSRFIAIDPAPRADISSLGVEIFPTTVQQVDLSLFSDLTSGDILFIDSSHIAMPGTDVDFLFLEILPALPKGVIVHIHDIFLPHDYPEGWHWRGYNEQQVVAPLLSAGYDLLFSSYYVQRYMGEALNRSVVGSLPIQDGAHETSLWLKKET
ncbi:class I SAM-dependent methyltransferase [Sneathiella sp.]|uniref:class I SAM-dependent methyltransferase n=2 Tax=Sneathiella TaxID=510690 RepID=UPI0039E586F7